MSIADITFRSADIVIADTPASRAAARRVIPEADPAENTIVDALAHTGLEASCAHGKVFDIRAVLPGVDEMTNGTVEDMRCLVRALAPWITGECGAEPAVHWSGEDGAFRWAVIGGVLIEQTPMLVYADPGADAVARYVEYVTGGLYARDPGRVVCAYEQHYGQPHCEVSEWVERVAAQEAGERKWLFAAEAGRKNIFL